MRIAKGNMMYKQIMLAIAAVLLLCFKAEADVNSEAGSMTIIEGDLSNAAEKMDSVSLTLFRERFGMEKTGGELMVSKIRMGKFRFTVKGLKGVAYIKFDAGLAQFLGKDIWLAEPGDSVYIRFTSSGPRFSGRQAEKYRCLRNVDSLTEEFIAQRRTGAPAEKKDLRDLLYSSAQRADSIYDLKMGILKTYRNVLSPLLLAVMQNDCYGENRYSKIVSFYFRWWPESFRLPDSVERREILRRFIKEEIASDTLRSSFLSKTISAGYISYLVQMEAFRMQAEQDNPKLPEIFDLVQEAGAKYRDSPSYFRDKLLTSVVLHYGRSTPDFMKAVEYCRREVQSPPYLQVIGHLKKIYSPLQSAYPFSLPDSNGVLHSLSDFKGKVVLLDLWFTGCMPCRYLAQRMKPVVEKFAGNSNMVFIGVNVDRSRNTWLQTLRSGEYTHASALNVFTAGSGTNHPMVKYYNIRGFPALILIDKQGRLVSLSPPLPDGSKEAEEKLLTLLNRLVNE